MKNTVLSTALVAVLALGTYAQFGNSASSQNMPMNHQAMGHSMMSGNMGNMSAMMEQMSRMMAQMTEMMKAEQGSDGSHEGMAGMSKGDQGPSSLAFAEANATMHAGMDIGFTGNADVDFVSGMIPHHEGAVAMAKIVLEYGKDPEIRKLAEAVVAAQESEIIFMREWLARNAK